MDPEGAEDLAALADGIRRGDGAAEEELVRRFREKAFVMALVRLRDREAARDVAQETMLAVLQGVRQGRLLEPAKLAGYVCGTARNLVHEHLRAVGPRPVFAAPDPPPVPDAEAELEQAERSFLVRRVLRDLASRDRLVLLLTLVDGLSPAEIAGRLGLQPEAVRQRKSRALRRARTLLEKLSRPAPGRHISPRET